MSKAIVREIQVCGVESAQSLEEAVQLLDHLMGMPLPFKIHFTIQLPDGSIKGITIRDDGSDTVAYGDFGGLPSFLNYAQEVQETDEESQEDT